MKNIIPFLLLGSAALSGASITVVPAAGSVAVGNNLTVNVLVDSTTPVYGWELTLGFTAGLVNGLTVAEGAFLPAGGGTTFFDAVPDNTAGTFGPVTGVLNGAVPGVAGSGTLVSFTFRSIAPGTVNLALIGASLLDETLFNIDTTTTGASFNVTGAAVPEPATGALAAVALALVARWQRRG